MKLISLAVLAVLPFAVAAQDGGAAKDFDAAFSHYFPGGDATREVAMVQGLAAIQGIEGRWIPAEILFPEGGYSAEMVEKACGFITFAIAPKGRFGFTMTRMRKEEATEAVVTYAFTYGDTFARTSDQDGFLEMLFPNMELSQINPAMLQSAIAGPTTHGYAQVRRIGTDVLVIDTVPGNANLFLRCRD